MSDSVFAVYSCRPPALVEKRAHKIWEVARG